MSEELAAHLARNIKQLRDARGLTQQQMAKASGLPRATWANLETGAANPTLSVLHKVAAALQAEKLIHLTDVEGIKGPGGDLISTLTQSEARRLVGAGVIDGGMLPKVESALRAPESGTAKAHILDGRIPHAILLEIFTKEGIGTEIVL